MFHGLLYVLIGINLRVVVLGFFHDKPIQKGKEVISSLSTYKRSGAKPK